MKQSKLMMPTLREGSSEAEAISHKLMLRAGLIRGLAAGIYTYLPLGRRVLRKVEGIVREEMDRAGAQELLMPAMQPAELWQQSGRYEQYGAELIRLQDRSGREFALGPTHEEVITAIADSEISSYRQLPAALYQIQTKYRDELRPRFGLLRGREFLMKDAYSFDADWDGLDRSYKQMYEAYHRIFTRIGLNYRAVEADGGTIGGEGGTHEFIALASIGEDTICTCDNCNYAANLEIVNRQETDLLNAAEGDNCPRCNKGLLQFNRGIEVGHVFKLGTKYSVAMKASFTASTGEEKPFIMGCYGIGISRLLSAVAEQRHDDNGICWPLALAPYHVHIIPISCKDAAQMQLAEQIASQLEAAGIEVLVDDRDERAGVKFKDSDLIGIPYRIVIGKQAVEYKVELKERGRAESHLIAVNEAVQTVIRAVSQLK